MRKPETTFTLSINKYLKDKVHCEKMHNPYRGGTPDFWYSGNLGDIWIEYKYIETIPIRSQIIPDLTPLQAQWLKRRYEEGRNVAVIVGTRAGGIFLPKDQFQNPLSPEEFKERILSRKDLADGILAITGESYAYSELYNARGKM